MVGLSLLHTSRRNSVEEAQKVEVSRNLRRNNSKIPLRQEKIKLAFDILKILKSSEN
jgi:hypothetical protein